MINSWLINWHDAKEEKPQEDSQVIMLLQHITLVGEYAKGAFYCGRRLGAGDVVELSFRIRINDADVMYWDYINAEGVNGIK